jgi:protocatechuate 3,4-dioxygenase beta subunit
MIGKVADFDRTGGTTMQAMGFRQSGRCLATVGFLVLAMALVLPAAVAAAEAEAPKLTVSGKAVDQDGKPVANAKVVLREWSSYRRGENPFAPIDDVLAATSTDEQGQFSFRDVPSRPFTQAWPEPAPWDVVVQAEGYALGWQHLAAASEPEPLSIVMEPEAKIAGQVVDQEGKPVAGARVSAEELALLGSPMRSDLPEPDRLDLGMSQAAPATQTDAQGHFQLAGLPSSMRITLMVRHDDFVRQPIFVATTEGPQPELVTRFVVGDQEKIVSYPVHTGNVVVKIQPGSRLSGQVTYADSGRPCAKARIALTSPSWYAVLADDEGRFTISGLSPADYSLMAYPPEETNYLVVQMTVPVTANEKNKELTLALKPGQAVTGKVLADDTHAGVPGIQVLYRPKVPETTPVQSLARAGMTDQQGAFRVVAPPGEAELILSGPVPRYNVPAWQFSQEEPESQFVKPITVAEGKPLAGVEFTVARGLVIGGIVTDPDGKPVADAEVYPVNDEYETSVAEQSARTDAAGRFVLSGFPPENPQELLVIHVERKLIASARVEAAHDDAPTRTVAAKIELRPAASAVGRVLVAGKPLAGAQVTLLYFRTQDGQRYAMASDFATTDEQGQYQFDTLEPGEEYAAAFQAQGYSQGQTQPFKPQPGQRVELASLEVLEANQSVSGVVVDPAGKPLEGVRVNALEPNGRAIGGAFTVEPTGKDGRFTIEGVPNPPFSLVAFLTAPGGADSQKAGPSARVDVKAGQTDVRIVLDPKGSSGAEKQ